MYKKTIPPEQWFNYYYKHVLTPRPWKLVSTPRNIIEIWYDDGSVTAKLYRKSNLIGMIFLSSWDVKNTYTKIRIDWLQKGIEPSSKYYYTLKRLETIGMEEEDGN